ncbi:aminoacyl-histidine dipeptidase [Sphingobacterium sp. N143]|uniref:aminoacyl-histidine dipeptidase n=1 Tax=Sphingobacterium sp. N143 TaxID=2746727 RepID=UPI002575ED15|nr:aminoacyl-histidine dipeptidase [Sphingobacterium sp. N143]MDM1292951.1 aminoacyl-histidine dipeptidase [Sphingobacterium sp. N143]
MAENNLDKLEPKAIWKNFAALNAVPRASKKEARVIAFMVDFGNSLGLATHVDEIGNVLIRKPATQGMEDRKTIVLQSHLDMVHQKNNDTVFDFDTEGIKMYVDGDWVKAEGTTLGADNGLGVATIMSILESTTIVHPAIEALFTIDEETGMTGALGLKGGLLSGEILLNLDTENDTEIDIGCAGGIDVTASQTYTPEPCPSGMLSFEITVKGLHGGHSGMDIHKGFANANKLMNRLLFKANERYGLRISSLLGGSLRNAIPRESVAKVVISEDKRPVFVQELTQMAQDIKQEFATTEPGMEILIEPQDVSYTTLVPVAAQENLINSVYAALNGVYRVSADFEDLVETSNNIAKVEVGAEQIVIKCLTRSSVETSKLDLAHSLQAAFELGGFAVAFSGDYPGWAPNPNSEILEVLKSIYQKQHGTAPEVVACHAGLECGILGTNYPGMDMISFGPTILGAHSPAERASVSSVQKFWNFVLEILKEIPRKK